MGQEAIRCAAIIVAAGSGSRMGGNVPKQFLELAGKPVLFHTLNTFERADCISEIVLITGREYIEYCRHEIVDKYGFSKVRSILQGGKERYDSVYAGLLACKDAEYVMIQDGVRPFADEDMLERGLRCAVQYGCAVAGMPAKDTIKIADENGIVQETPDRRFVWVVQTPQIFRRGDILEAYQNLMRQGASGFAGVTDDAMVMEKGGTLKIRMFEGSYENIKLTTPEDLKIGASVLSGRSRNK